MKKEDAEFHVDIFSVAETQPNRWMLRAYLRPAHNHTHTQTRKYYDLLEVFKMYKGMSLQPFHQFFRNSTVVITRGHSAKLGAIQSTDRRHYFFSNRVIDRWN